LQPRGGTGNVSIDIDTFLNFYLSLICKVTTLNYFP